MLPPESVMVVPPSGALSVPPQSESAEAGSAIVTPAGRLSLNARLETGKAPKFSISKRSVVALPGPIVAGLNDFSKPTETPRVCPLASDAAAISAMASDQKLTARMAARVGAETKRVRFILPALIGFLVFAGKSLRIDRSEMVLHH